MKRPPKKEQQSPATSPLLFKAKVIATREVFESLEPSLDPCGDVEQQADGRWVVPATLGATQLEPLVAAGATLVLEGLFDPRFPQEWVMPIERGMDQAQQLLRRFQRAEASRAEASEGVDPSDV